ncbi:hypothetical protein [Bacillus sp. CGMCC 1.16541]|uniref:hypothetical protein n=1 Tax=Bacillus sp. CGMCC 1.16541 TaxID=2185143 RepID=UPI000D72DE7C|nr:hypothetical protein [Bacillus sp. CGMCC 1.16541]
MPSKTFLFNRGILTQTLRNVGWTSLLFFVLLFFSVPLQLLMKYTQERDPFEQPPVNLFAVSGDLQVVFLFTVPVLLAIFLFRYMHVKLAADFIHGLPIKREPLFHQQVIIGALLLITPLILVSIINACLIPFLNISDIFSTSDVINWFLTTATITLLVYMSSVFVSTFTGMSVLHGLLTYVLIGFPFGMMMLIVMNLRYALTGLAIDYYLHGRLSEYLLLPARYTHMIQDRLLTGTEFFIYITLILVFYVTALLVYRKRNVEVANSAVAFKPLQPLFKYGVTFCFALVGGLYFLGAQHSLSWGIFGYGIGALLGYVISQMILDKTWRIASKWKGYVGFIIIFGIIGVILYSDITGFESKVPEAEDVERVYLSDGFYSLFVSPEDFKDVDDYMYKEYEPFYYEEKENIKHIIQLHEAISAEHDQHRRLSQQGSQSVSLVYELKNGKKLVRQYIIPYQEYKVFYEPIVASDEHMENYHQLLKDQNLENVEQLIIRSHDGRDKQVTISDPKQVRELLEVIKKDMRSQSYEDLYRYSGNEAWGDIELIRPDKKALSYVTWHKSYAGVDEWLQQQGLREEARQTGNDYSKVIILKNDFKKSMDELTKEEIEKHADKLTVTDSNKIDEILTASIWDDRGEYLIAFYDKEQRGPITRTFRNDKVPDFVKQHFNNK